MSSRHAFALILLATATPAFAQDFDITPVPGVTILDGRGPDGLPDTNDDYDGEFNSPNLRGPDMEPGTEDDLRLYIWGTGGGTGGCFTNNTPNCVGAAGGKSAEWHIEQVVDAADCQVLTTVTNISDGEPGCPLPGCISEWNSPGLPNFQAAVRAALPLAPEQFVGPIADGPGPGTPNCTPRVVNYNMAWNPTTPLAPILNLGPPVNILMIDQANNSVLELDGTPGSHLEPDGGIVGELIPPGVLSLALDLDFGADGNLLILDFSQGVLKFDLEGTFLDTVVQPGELVLPRRIEVLPNGDIAISDVAGDGAIVIFNNDGLPQNRIEGPHITTPLAMAVNPGQPNLVFYQDGREIKELDWTNGLFTRTLPLPDRGYTDLATAGGHLLLTHSADGGGLVRVDPVTGEIVDSFGGQLLNNVQGGVWANGRIYASDNSTSSFFGKSTSVWGDLGRSQGAFNNGFGDRNPGQLASIPLEPAGILQVTPETGWTVVATKRPPDDPLQVAPQQEGVTHKTYTLRNIGDAPLSWTADAFASWAFTVDRSGSLAPNEETEVVVSRWGPFFGGTLIDEIRGLRTGSASFRNTTNNIGTTSRRLVLLLARNGDPIAVSPSPKCQGGGQGSLQAASAGTQPLQTTDACADLIYFCADSGECLPNLETIDIGNPQEDPISLQIETDGGFLDLSLEPIEQNDSLKAFNGPLEIELQPSAISTLTVTPNETVGALEAGEHLAQVTLTDMDTSEVVTTRIVKVVRVADLADLHELYFAHFAEGLGLLFSRLLLFDLEEGAGSNARVELRDDAGDAAPVDFDGEIFQGNLSLTLTPSGLRVLTTDGEGDLLTGSVIVTSENLLAGVLLFGGAVGTAGVGASPVLAPGFIAPMETSDSRAVNTGVAVMNLETTEVTVDLQLCDSDGTVLATAQLTVPGRGHLASFVNQFEWSAAIDFSEFRGLLKATADGKLGATVLQSRGDEFATMPVAALPDAGGAPANVLTPLVGFPAAEGEQTLYFAQFGEGLDLLFSQLLLLNLDPDNEAAIQALLKDDDGLPLSVDLNGVVVEGQLDAVIPAGGLRTFEADGMGPLATGSVIVSSDRPLAGVVLFGGSAGVAGVGSSEELPIGFLAPMQSSDTEELNSGIAVMNLDAGDVTVNLQLFDLDGSLLATSQIVLASMGHRARFLNEIEWSVPIDFSEFAGILKATATGRIAATVLQTTPGQFATMPVAPLPQ